MRIRNLLPWTFHFARKPKVGRQQQREVDALPDEHIAVRVLADQILQAAPGLGVEVKDARDFTLLRANDQACQWLGQPECKLLSKTVHELVRDEASAQLIDAADKEAVRSGRHDMEAWCLLNNGLKRRLRATRFLFIDRHSTNQYLVTITTDITEQHTAHLRAEDLERTTTSLLSGLPFPIVWLDRRQIIKGSNPAFNSFAGVTLPVNHTLVDVFPFAVATALQNVCKLTEDTRRPMTQQVTVWSANEGGNREMIVHTCPMHDQFASVIGTVSAMYDVTDLVNSTRVTSEISRAFDATTDAVILTNRRNEITYANAEFCRQYGYSREELMGAQPSVLKSGVHTDVFYKHMWDTLTSGSTWHGVMIDHSRLGRAVTCPTTIVPILNGSQTPVAYLCIKHTEGRHEAPIAIPDIMFPDRRTTERRGSGFAAERSDIPAVAETDPARPVA